LTSLNFKEKKMEINFINSNLSLTGCGRDVNGNSVIRVKFPNSRAFSIQVNAGSTKLTKSNYGDLKYLEDLDNRENIEKEIEDYVEKYGSKKQKAELKRF